MADNFSKFKKRYNEGKIPTMAMPPVVPGPGGLARSAAGVVARPLLRHLQEGIKSAAESAGKSKVGKSKGSPKTRGGSGTFTDKLSATRTRARTEKESEKFGPLVKRKDNLPAKQNRAIVKREENMPATRGGRDLAVVREGKGDLVRTGTRTFGDKGQGGRIVGLSPKGKLAAGAAAAGAAAIGYASYKKADSVKADEPQRTASGKVDRESSTIRDTSPANKSKSGSSVGGTKNGPLKSEFAHRSLQGRKASPVLGKGKSGSPKSAPGTKKMSPFEREKQRRYEKEGLGGRSMTSSGAKKQVMKERSFKFKDLFK